MSEPGTRPGGLTALAVINFVWAAFELAIGAGTVTSPSTMPALIAQAEKDAAAETRPEQRKMQRCREAARGHAQRQRADPEQHGLVMLVGGVKLLFGLAADPRRYRVPQAAAVPRPDARDRLRRGLAISVGSARVAPYTQKRRARRFGISSLIGFIYPGGHALRPPRDVQATTSPSRERASGRMAEARLDLKHVGILMREPREVRGARRLRHHVRADRDRARARRRGHPDRSARQTCARSSSADRAASFRASKFVDGRGER